MSQHGRDDDDRAPIAPDGDPERDADEIAGTDALAAALLHAVAPGELDDEVNERLIAAAIERVHSPMVDGHDELPTPREIRDAEALRQALEAPQASIALRTDETARLAELARALRLAHAPTAIDEVRNQAILRDALGTRRVGRVAIVATFFAAAAAVLLFVGRTGSDDSSAQHPSAALIPGRSTQDLFDPAEPFPRAGGTTDRIDKIASSRDRDVRQNRFATWGIE